MPIAIQTSVDQLGGSNKLDKHIQQTLWDRVVVKFES